MNNHNDHDKMSTNTSKPWWNRPLLGKRTLMDYLLISTDNRKQIPPEIIYVYNQALHKLELLTITIKALLNEKFAGEEFLVFARMKNSLIKNESQETHYFNQIADFLKLIINNLNSLRNLILIEEKFTSKYCQEFYDFVIDLESQNLSKILFQETLRKKIESTILNLSKSNEIEALYSYANQIYDISNSPDILKKYFSFKQLKLYNWSILNQIADLIVKNGDKNLADLNRFILFVEANYDWFKNLENYSYISEYQIDKITHGKILQYLTLNYKYESIYQQFRQFLSYLGEWEKTYYHIFYLKEEYPISHYHYPWYFYKSIPGFEIYKSYHDYLDSSCMYPTNQNNDREREFDVCPQL